MASACNTVYSSNCDKLPMKHTAQMLYATSRPASALRDLFLLLADARGWAFEAKGETLALQEVRDAEAGHWRCTSIAAHAMEVYIAPSSRTTVRTGAVVVPGEVVLISERCSSLDSVVYLKLADGRGWVVGSRPGAEGWMVIS